MGDIVFVTGHRPDKLGGYSVEAHDRLVDFCRTLVVSPDIQTVITGMALGFDQAVAEACYKEGVPFHAYVPFLGQQNRWPLKAKQKYEKLLRRASEVVVVSSGGYGAWKLQIRNQAMVDVGDRGIALWNGSPGGTSNCLTYAKTRGREVQNVWDLWEEYKG